ncbi:MAG: hypothetical protein K2R98_30165 [Gemmataceae bacterium]|nr:hypothetical protein [Gemmataceae bacterium]
MGLAKVRYDGLVPTAKGLRAWADVLGISPEEVVEAIALILDNWRRNRILYVTGDPIFSHSHPKNDPYIQAGLLPLKDFRPEGLLLTAGPSDDYARSLIAQRGTLAVQALLKKWTTIPQTLDVDAATTMLWEYLTDEAKLLTRVTLRSQKEMPLGGDVSRGQPAPATGQLCRMP